MRKPFNAIKYTAGAVAAFFFALFFPAWAIGALVLCLLAHAVDRMIPSQDRKFVKIVLLITVTAKIILMTAYFYMWLLPGRQDIIGPDGEGFSQRGWYISRVLSDKVSYETPTGEYVFPKFYRVVDYYKRGLPPFNSRGNGLFTYFIGVVYFLLGYAPLLIKFFNVFFSAIASIVLYRLARETYDRSAARTAFLMFTFFPSIFIFSISALREPLFILCVISAIYSLTRLAARVRFREIAVLAVSLILILFLRDEFFIIVMSVVALTMLLQRGVKHKIAIILLIALFAVTATRGGIFYRIRFNPGTFFNKAAPMIFVRNAALYFSGGNLSYKTFDDRHYTVYRNSADEEGYYRSADRVNALDIIKTLPRAIFYYIARPFPSFHRGLIYSLLSIHMLFWYAVFIMALFGVCSSRPRSSAVYPVILYMLMTMMITCMFEANEGILLRHRDFIAPFLIIFASAFIDRTIHGKAAYE